jgi:hypothetical protein
MGLVRLMLVAALVATAAAARAEAPEFTPTGQFVTPRAAPGATFEPLNPQLPGDPHYTAGNASAVALSPDGRTLLVREGSGALPGPPRPPRPARRPARAAGGGRRRGVRGGHARAGRRRRRFRGQRLGWPA